MWRWEPLPRGDRPCRTRAGKCDKNGYDPRLKGDRVKETFLDNRYDVIPAKAGIQKRVRASYESTPSFVSPLIAAHAEFPPSRE